MQWNNELADAFMQPQVFFLNERKQDEDKDESQWIVANAQLSNLTIPTFQKVVCKLAANKHQIE